MKYQLIGKNNFFNPIETILHNRGIEDIETFLNVSDKDVIHWSKLKNIDDAVNCLLSHIERGSKIFIQADSDQDGIASSSILINYLNTVFPDCKLQWRIQEGKEHGVIVETVPNDTNLVIVPDAGSNQYEEHKILKEKGMDVLVIDHHECEEESKDAIVVNNQLSPDYPNKSLTGSAMVYKVLKAVDERLNINQADYYLDLVAIGLIGDLADSRVPETRYYMNEGLKHINNSFLKALFEKQSYSTKGKINIVNCQFYIVPLVNAAIRIGNMQEKLQMMNAFLESKELIYNKRKDESEEIQVATARMLGNIKSRQARLRDKGVKLIEQRIHEKKLLDNKVLIVNVTDLLDKNLTGLVANSLAKQYKRPVLLLRYNEKDNVLQGSGRGYDKGFIKGFRGFLNDTGLFNYCEGHSEAFGASICPENLIEVNKIINQKLEGVEIDSDVYDVDFVIPMKSLSEKFIKELNEYRNVWGHNVEEPLIVAKDLEINAEDIQILGANKTILKFICKGIEYIKFSSSEDEWKDIVDKGERLVMDVVGRCSVNEYQGKKVSQMIVDDYEVVGVKKKKFVF